jgi:hypothetical protein
MSQRRIAIAAFVSLASCVGTTGGDLVTFGASASGPADAPGGSIDFMNDRGWHVVLTRAVVHVGAIYLNQSRPVSGAQATSCILNGTYVAQVTVGLDVDVLTATPQPFPVAGTGIVLPALAGQVWLTGGDIEAVDDRTHVLELSGTADRSGTMFDFTATLTIGKNRAADTASGGAGAISICKQRIVSPISTSIEPASRGSLSLRIDPRALFINVDFTDVTPTSGAYVLPDDSSDQPSRNLYQNLHSSAPYGFEWVP